MKWRRGSPILILPAFLTNSRIERSSGPDRRFIPGNALPDFAVQFESVQNSNVPQLGFTHRERDVKASSLALARSIKDCRATIVLPAPGLPSIRE
jgi:hypothetical protein